MVRSSGYFKEIGDAFSRMPSSEELELIYESPSGHSALYKGRLGDRIVVLKCLKPEFRGDGTREAILRHEYEIAHPLKHPGVCDYLSWIHHRELGECIVLEWIDGRTLEDLVKAGALDRKSAFRIILQLCDAVSYIHRKQVLHNDLKPENIMVAREGSVVKVIDFSLADSSSMAGGHLPAGTEGYAAPEVASGGEATIRSDIFSLGRIISEILPSRKDVSDKCMKDDPLERYALVEEVKAALESRRRSWWKILLSSAVLLGAVLMLLWLPGRGRRDEDSGMFRKAVSLVRDSASPTPSLDASGYLFTDTLDCFNGKFIVTCAQGEGIMDEDGTLLLEPVWSDIEFLSPDVALLSRNGLSYLSSSEGRIFAEGTDREALAASFQDSYERMLFEDMRRWDEVLDNLDSLCWSCISRDGNGGSAPLFERLKESLHSVSGNMTGSQSQRLGEIEERFEFHKGR